MNIKSPKPGWKMVKFGDVVKNANLVERDLVKAAIEQIVGLEHIDPDNLHIRRWNTPENGTSFSRKFVPGQTLFGKRRAYQRKVAYAEFEGICSGDILTFESKDPKVLLPELLPFICQSDAFFDYALGTSAGSLSPRTSWKALKDFKFSLPPIEEQKRIAEILWAADEAVEKYRELWNALDQLSTAYTDALIENLNESWPKIPLGKLTIGKVQYGANAPACKHKEGMPRYVRITDIDSFGDLCSIDEVSVKLSDDDLLKYSLDEGDLLFARTGNTVGKTYLYKKNDGHCVYAGYLVRFKPDPNKVLPSFLFQYTRSTHYKKWVENTVRVGAQPNINGKEYSSFMIATPSIDEQLVFMSNISTLLSSKKRCSEYIVNLKLCIKSLQQSIYGDTEKTHV